MILMKRYLVLLTCRSKTFGLKRYKNNRSFIKTFGNRTEIISEVGFDKEQNNFYQNPLPNGLKPS
jgi:SNF2 family DNA or RNA helicase